MAEPRRSWKDYMLHQRERSAKMTLYHMERRVRDLEAVIDTERRIDWTERFAMFGLGIAVCTAVLALMWHFGHQLFAR